MSVCLITGSSERIRQLHESVSVTYDMGDRYDTPAHPTGGGGRRRALGSAGARQSSQSMMISLARSLGLGDEGGQPVSERASERFTVSQGHTHRCVHVPTVWRVYLTLAAALCCGTVGRPSSSSCIAQRDGTLTAGARLTGTPS